MAKPKPEIPKVSVTFTIDSDVSKDIETMAQKAGISKSALVNMMLRGICFQEWDVVNALLGVVSDNVKSKKRVSEPSKKRKTTKATA